MPIARVVVKQVPDHITLSLSMEDADRLAGYFATGEEINLHISTPQTYKVAKQTKTTLRMAVQDFNTMKGN